MMQRRHVSEPDEVGCSLEEEMEKELAPSASDEDGTKDDKQEDEKDDEGNDERRDRVPRAGSADNKQGEPNTDVLLPGNTEDIGAL
ncbi:hypothetical protein scyTo_0000574 [Scyliorhinus torazame]|uniref:Uncharacterized protein n=1 Tax=Scyliorhinus torazame TaxID=75743 RepID=A0A401NZL2_SCYTO|nr:hypothetical protein [Scyliorhinus torazame]